jgi:hypothetical protein
MTDLIADKLEFVTDGRGTGCRTSPHRECGCEADGTLSPAAEVIQEAIATIVKRGFTVNDVEAYLIGKPRGMEPSQHKDPTGESHSDSIALVTNDIRMLFIEAGHDPFEPGISEAIDIMARAIQDGKVGAYA